METAVASKQSEPGRKKRQPFPLKIAIHRPPTLSTLVASMSSTASSVNDSVPQTSFDVRFTQMP